MTYPMVDENREPTAACARTGASTAGPECGCRPAAYAVPTNHGLAYANAPPLRNGFFASGWFGRFGSMNRRNIHEPFAVAVNVTGGPVSPGTVMGTTSLRSGSPSGSVLRPTTFTNSSPPAQTPPRAMSTTL